MEVVHNGTLALLAYPILWYRDSFCDSWNICQFHFPFPWVGICLPPASRQMLLYRNTAWKLPPTCRQSETIKNKQPKLYIIHTLQVHLSPCCNQPELTILKYTKLVCVHYFCMIAIPIYCAMLMRTWASCRFDSHAHRVGSFAIRVIVFCG